MTLKTQSINSDATEQIGAKLGSQLKGGEVIELTSDLGGGKTTFVRGLAKGVGSSDHVASPTFTINRIYKTEKLSIYHFDLYRLPEPGIIQDEIMEVLNDPTSVVVIEWADIVEDILPVERLNINFRVLDDENKRELTFVYPEKLAYLLEGMQ